MFGSALIRLSMENWVHNIAELIILKIHLIKLFIVINADERTAGGMTVHTSA